MTIADEWAAMETEANQPRLKVAAVEKIVSDMAKVQSVYKFLKGLSDSGLADELPTEIKAELVFYYQQLTAFKDALTSRASFIEFYNVVNDISG